MEADALFDMPPTAGVLAGATISPCGTYRYTLDRIWDAGEPVALFIMLNPSTADASEDDPTIRRCISFAKRMGCGGLTVVNLFALRSTDPSALTAHPEPVGPDNDAHIALAFSKKPGCVVAAWGAHPAAKGRASAVAAIAAAYRWELSCLGTTKQGEPRHPLYLRGDAPLVPLEVKPA